MDKNTIIGFVLIGIVLFGFSWLNRPTPEQIEAQRRYQDSIAQIEQVKQAAIEKQKADPMASFNNLPDSVKEARLADSFGSFAKAMTGTEEFITLENEKVAVKLSTKGGRVISATLKEYDNYKGEPLVLFDKNESVFDLALVTAANQRVNTKDMYFTPIKGDNANAAVMRLQMNEGSYLDFIYTLQPNDYRMDFSIKGTGLNGMLSPSTETLGMTWTQDIRQQEKGRKFENRYVGLYYKVENDDVENLSETGNDSKNVNETLQWIGYKDMFFSTVLVAKEGFKEVKMDSRMYENGEYTVGLTDYAVEQLGDIVFLELPEVGTEFHKGETFATVESVKAASEIYMPISGKVTEVNNEVADSPEILNEDSYEKGWLVKIEKTGDEAELGDLMEYEDYKEELE